MEFFLTWIWHAIDYVHCAHYQQTFRRDRERRKERHRLLMSRSISQQLRLSEANETRPRRYISFIQWSTYIWYSVYASIFSLYACNYKGDVGDSIFNDYYYYWILITQESKKVKHDLYCVCILIIMNNKKGNCSISLVSYLAFHFLIASSLSISEIERVVHSKKWRQVQSS